MYSLSHRFLTTIESIENPKGWLKHQLCKTEWIDESHIRIDIRVEHGIYIALFGTKKNQKYIVFSKWTSSDLSANEKDHKLVAKAIDLIQKSKQLRNDQRKTLKANKLYDIIKALNFSQDYIIKAYSDTELTLEYCDGYEKETIEISRFLNEFNIEVFDLTIQSIQFDNEIVSPYSCHDCGESCDNFKIGDCIITDNDIRKEIDSYESKFCIRIEHRGGLLTIFNEVFEENCFNDIPHNHLFKGITIKLEKTTDKPKLIATIQARDILREIWQNLPKPKGA